MLYSLATDRIVKYPLPLTHTQSIEGFGGNKFGCEMALYDVPVCVFVGNPQDLRKKCCSQYTRFFSACNFRLKPSFRSDKALDRNLHNRNLIQHVANILAVALESGSRCSQRAYLLSASIAGHFPHIKYQIHTVD
jgi:hypothetical protein